MTSLYTPKQVALRLGISVTTVRAYTDRYARHLSTEATATPRRLTPDDLRVLAFVIVRAGQGKTHEQILAGWDDDYPNFTWADEDEEDAESAESTALVPAAQLQAARALMLDAQRREQEVSERAEARERELQEQVNQLLRELGKTEGELAAIRMQMQSSPKESRSWWARLFGGE